MVIYDYIIDFDVLRRFPNILNVSTNFTDTPRMFTILFFIFDRRPNLQQKIWKWALRAVNTHKMKIAGFKSFLGLSSWFWPAGPHQWLS